MLRRTLQKIYSNQLLQLMKQQVKEENQMGEGGHLKETQKSYVM